MATKKAAKKATAKKTSTKKTTKTTAAKKETTKSTSKKKAAAKATEKVVNAKAAPAPAVEEQETPTTLKKAAEKKPAKAKKPTKKEQAAAKEMNELMEKWVKLKELDHEIPTKKYKMTEVYSPSTPLEHPSLGWGFILSVQNNRLEVLFESGIKMLISNYKG
ncbi:MAG: hypothetical protein M9899_04940 [Bdellovibrionaceae bacterium]|nr:hypothetical protein [Pseudobdellovibrionaceae bacterium]